LDFGRAFFSVVVKEGSSNIFHVDFNDNPRILAWIVSLED